MFRDGKSVFADRGKLRRKRSRRRDLRGLDSGERLVIRRDWKVQTKRWFKRMRAKYVRRVGKEHIREQREVGETLLRLWRHDRDCWCRGSYPVGVWH